MAESVLSGSSVAGADLLTMHEVVLQGYSRYSGQRRHLVSLYGFLFP